MSRWLIRRFGDGVGVSQTVGGIVFASDEFLDLGTGKSRQRQVGSGGVEVGQDGRQLVEVELAADSVQGEVELLLARLVEVYVDHR